MNAPDPAHRQNYYRKVAISRGVPQQFLDDAVVAISEAVDSADPRYWKRHAMLAAIDQVRHWRGGTRRGQEPRPEPIFLDDLLRHPSSTTPDPIDPMDEEDKRRAVHEVFRILPIKEHAVLELRTAGWRHHEIAELFGISESRAATIEKHGIKRLRKALG